MLGRAKEEESHELNGEIEISKQFVKIWTYTSTYWKKDTLETNAPINIFSRQPIHLVLAQTINVDGGQIFSLLMLYLFASDGLEVRM